MTIEKLKRYRELKTELEDMDSQIIIVKDSTKGTSKYPPYIMQTHHIEGVAPDDYNLLEHKADLKAQIDEIEDFVKSIDDSIIRKAIILKYIEIKKDHKKKKMPAPKWFQVAQQIDCGLSGDGLRMKVKRFLKKI